MVEPDVPVVTVPIDSLTPHPRNYRSHPEDQIAHLVASIQQHGFYRPVVVANGDVILAGHGIVQAAKKLGLAAVPVVRLPIDPDGPRALKVLAGDNMLAHLSMDDDRALTEMLKEIAELDGLLGTGLDEQQLAALAFVTRPPDMMAKKEQTADWVGLPGLEAAPDRPRVMVSFKSAEDRQRFLDTIGAKVLNHKNGEVWSIWWPEQPREDLSGVRFEEVIDA